MEKVVQLRANVFIELRGPGGELKERHEYRNLICTAGKQQILAASSAKYLNQFAYLAIGSGSTPAVIGDTTLQTELARSSVITPTNPDANTLQFVAAFGAGVGTGTIAEYGLLSASSGGYLLSHLVSGTITKGASDSLTVTYQIT